MTARDRGSGVGLSALHRRRAPFGRQSRRYRNRAYIGIKNKIRRHAPILGGLFTTHDYMHGRNGWIDGYFLGRKAPVFYNFSLDTTRYAYKERICDEAYERSYALVPESAPSLSRGGIKDPQTGAVTLQPRHDRCYAEFGGLTRYQWSEQQIPALADAKATVVFEQWSLHHDYRYGIGLHATIDVPYLTIGAVNDFVLRFLATGGNFRSATALSYAYADIEYWGVESNAIIEPEGWGNLGRSVLLASQRHQELQQARENVEQSQVDARGGEDVPAEDRA